MRSQSKNLFIILVLSDEIAIKLELVTEIELKHSPHPAPWAWWSVAHCWWRGFPSCLIGSVVSFFRILSFSYILPGWLTCCPLLAWSIWPPWSVTSWTGCVDWMYCVWPSLLQVRDKMRWGQSWRVMLVAEHRQSNWSWLVFMIQSCEKLSELTFYSSSYSPN